MSRAGRLQRQQARDRAREYEPPPKVVGFRVRKAGAVVYEGPSSEEAAAAVIEHGADGLETIEEGGS